MINTYGSCATSIYCVDSTTKDSSSLRDVVFESFKFYSSIYPRLLIHYIMMLLE